MSFLKELESKKEQLKKTDIPKEVKFTDKLLFENDDDYIRLLRETKFENYYDLMEEFTFKSVILSLTKEEIQALYEENLSFDKTQGNVSLLNYDLINSIANKIDEGIKSIQERTKNPSVQCFLRLSTRSPKDAIFHMSHFLELYDSKLKELKHSDMLSVVDKNNLYSKLIAYYQASTEILAISMGKEGVNLLIMSNRIQDDLKLSLEKSESLNLIIREFVQFPVEHELRGFVWKKRLTALSQYNNIAFLPSLVKNKDEIENKVRIFMDKFIPIVSDRLENFVVDIVLDYNGKVWIVELNPFGELAGSCLFSWISDRELLLNEEGRYEFRINDNPPDITYVKGQLNEQAITFLDI